MKTELSILNKRRKTNGIKWRKVAHGNLDITRMWGKGPAPSGTVECRAYNMLNDATCIQYCHGKAENTIRDTLLETLEVSGHVQDRERTRRLGTCRALTYLRGVTQGEQIPAECLSRNVIAYESKYIHGGTLPE